MANSDTDTDRPTPNDYDAADGWDHAQALNKCPRCDVVMSANGGYFDTVYDQDGTSYDSIYETDPNDGPFFCAACWTTLTVNQKQQANRTLDDFA